jgi:hypothetical protein
MLVYTVLKVLAAAGLVSSYAIHTGEEASVNGYLEVRQNDKTPDPTEIAAHSRLPNVPLPKEISDSTKSLLQFMTIWEQAEISAINDVINAVSKSTTLPAPWTGDEVVRILQVGQAVSTSHMSPYSNKK